MLVKETVYHTCLSAIYGRLSLPPPIVSPFVSIVIWTQLQTLSFTTTTILTKTIHRLKAVKSTLSSKPKYVHHMLYNENVTAVKSTFCQSVERCPKWLRVNDLDGSASPHSSWAWNAPQTVFICVLCCWRDTRQPHHTVPESALPVNRQYIIKVKHTVVLGGRNANITAWNFCADSSGENETGRTG